MRSRERERFDRGISVLGPAAAVALGGALLIVAALAFGAVPLLVGGVGFVLLAVIVPAWAVLAARGATVTRQLTGRRVVEDEPLELTVVVRRGPLGLPGAEVFEPIAGTRIAVREALSLLTGSRQVELRVVTRLARRGRYTFAPPTLCVADTLSLVALKKAGSGPPDELLVLPRTEPVRWQRSERRTLTRGQSSSSAHEPIGAGELDGLRPYVEGSSASRIHWPALARGAGLLERRLVSEPHAQPMVVLDARQGGLPGDQELLDAAVRATASLTLEFAAAGGCSVLLPGLRLPIDVSRDLAAWPAVHTRLALVQGSRDDGPGLRVGAARGPLIYVAARLDGPPRVPASGRLASSFVLVIPAVLGEGLSIRPSFEVSGCAGYQLSSRAARRRRRAA